MKTRFAGGRAGMAWYGMAVYTHAEGDIPRPESRDRSPELVLSRGM